MMHNWTLVTGGAKRLGASICLKLAQQGHSVLIHYRNSQNDALNIAEACQKYGVKAECIYGDFSSFHSTKQFIDDINNKFSNIENLINNVGNYSHGSLENTSLEDWEQLYQINVHAPFACIQGLLSSLKSHQGCIINIGTAGISALHANGPAPAYRSTKTSLWMLTRLLARELAPFQVRVNMVSPGQLEISQDAPHPSSTPMKRLGKCDEVADMVAFLLTQKYVTGQNIEVAGALAL